MASDSRINDVPIFRNPEILKSRGYYCQANLGITYIGIVPRNLECP